MPALKNRIEKLERSFPEARALTQDDEDALTLYRGCRLLRADMSPSYRDLEATAAYARGREIVEQTQDQIPDGTESSASSTFKLLFGRLPEPGDMMHFWQVELIPKIEQRLQLDFHKELIAAWGRQFKGMPCPLRFEGEKLLKRTPSTKLNGPVEWEEYKDVTAWNPERDWLEIEREAQLLDDDSPMPRVSAVVFRDAVHCRPAKERELKEDQTESSGGLLGVLVKEVHRLKEEGVIA
jgi:hypothetical protein